MHIRHVMAAAVVATTIVGAVGLTFARSVPEPLIALVADEAPAPSDAKPILDSATPGQAH